jgi:HK97 family phage prohead protease
MNTDTRKARASLLTGREVRRQPTSEMECRTVGDQITFHGLASSTDSPYEMGFYTETIQRGAFDVTLGKRPDVQLLVNHEGLPLARTTNGSLTLQATERGLEFTATAASSDPDAARVAAKVESGLMDQCSFAFRAMEQEWDEDYTQRCITEVSLDRGDVSVVNYGANPNTSVSLRSLFADVGTLSDDEIDELRNDPAIITVVRKLQIPVEVHADVPEFVTKIEEAVTIAEAAKPDERNIEYYRARAYALGLRN